MTLGSLGAPSRVSCVPSSSSRQFLGHRGAASIASHRGQHQDAREWAERTLKIVPVSRRVLCLAAAELAAGDGSSAEQRLRQ